MHMLNICVGCQMPHHALLQALLLTVGACPGLALLGHCFVVRPLLVTRGLGPNPCGTMCNTSPTQAAPACMPHAVNTATVWKQLSSVTQAIGNLS